MRDECLQTGKTTLTLLFTYIQMFFVSACCAAGDSSEQRTNTGHNTEVCERECSLRNDFNSCIYQTGFLFLTLCRERIMQITNMRRSIFSRSSSKRVHRCLFTPSSTLQHTQFTMSASSSRTMQTLFLTQTEMAPLLGLQSPLYTPLSV